MGGEESAEFYWLGEKKRRILTEEFLPEKRDKRLALYPGRKRNRRDLNRKGECVWSGTSEGQTVGRAGVGLVMGVLAAQQRSSVLPEERKLLQRSFERRHKYHEFSRLPESKTSCRGFSRSPVVRGPGLIPDPGTKILQAMWHNQKNKIK